MRYALIAAPLCVMALVALTGAPAQAAPPTCGAGTRPWVRVSPGDADFVPRLRAELGGRGIDVCDEGSPGGTKAIASINVELRTEGVGIVVAVRDEVTSKRVARDFSLEDIPADGRPLVVAMAVSELLRASWAELSMADAARPAEPVPPAVRAAVESDVRRPAPDERTVRSSETGRGRETVGGALAFEHFSGGLNLFGVDARGAVSFGRVSGAVQLGVRQSSDSAAADGSVRATAFVAGLGFHFTITPRDSPLVLNGVARCNAWGVRFDASSVGATEALPGTTVAVTCDAGLAAAWRLSSAFDVGSEALFLGVIRPASASDDAVRVVAMSGVGVGFAITLQGRL